jgi:hypothetical protein
MASFAVYVDTNKNVLDIGNQFNAMAKKQGLSAHTRWINPPQSVLGLHAPDGLSAMSVSSMINAIPGVRYVAIAKDSDTRGGFLSSRREDAAVAIFKHRLA